MLLDIVALYLSIVYAYLLLSSIGKLVSLFVTQR
jgi:hypothetical protein